MKNLVKLLLCVTVVFAMMTVSCPDENNQQKKDDEFKGDVFISITNSATPIEEASINATLQANYNGTDIEPDKIYFEWKVDGDEPSNIPTGDAEEKLVAQEEGLYTVTVRANGSKKSKTSAPVIVSSSQFTVTFDRDNGQANAITTVNANKSESLGNKFPANPSKSGFAFKGWFDENDTQFTRDTPITCSVTLKAKWAAAKTVTFNLSGASLIIPSQLVEIGQKIVMPTTPEMIGYVFGGWFLTNDFAGEEFVPDTPITEDITLYAKWTFSGGTPQVVDGTLVHENPMLTSANATNTQTPSTWNGTILGSTVTFQGGAFQYKFPVEAAEYDYFIISFAVEGEGNTTTVRILKHDTASDYQFAFDQQPWLSNLNGSLLLEVGGAGTTSGVAFRFQGTSGTDIKVTINRVTFYKAPRITVTFNIGYTGGTNPAPIANVWGKDSRHNGKGLGAQFPADPADRMDEEPPMYFNGWYDVDSIVTELTSYSKDTTLTAKWVAQKDSRFIEFIDVKGNVTAPLYGFELPAGEVLGNYTRIKARVKNPSHTSNRFRVWGTFPASIWTASIVPGVTGANIQNAGTGLLLVTGSADSISGSSDGVWREYTLVFNKAANYGTDSGITGQWSDSATGVVRMALGLIGAAGNNDPRTYFIKDVRLCNADDTKVVPALDPRSDLLWGGNGAGAYAQASGSISGLIRQILPYEE